MNLKTFRTKGITLVEVILVTATLLFLLSVVIPFSYSSYLYYKNSREVEKFVIFLSSLRREAFLHSKEFVIYKQGDKLYINETNINNFHLSLKIEKPIYFYKNGTSSGGIIFVYFERYTFKIVISYPFGEIYYERV